MKRSIIFIMSFILCSLALVEAQEENEFRYYQDNMRTLFGHGKSNGGYGAFSIGYAEIDHRDAIQFSGRGAWIIHHSFAIGLAGTGFINELHYDPAVSSDVFLTGGYGGLLLEPIIAPRFPVHLSFPVVLGAGGIAFISEEYDVYRNFVEDTDAFLVIEPGAELELNVTRFFRLAFGASYRHITGFNLNYNQSESTIADTEALKGISFALTFKFGKF